MIEALLGGASLEPAVLARIVVAAEGNPLYVEQLLRTLTDEGTLEQRDGGWVATSDLAELQVPPTIQALLASRLDTLESAERLVIEPASVVGYVFPEAAVAALAPPDVSPRVPLELATLTHKHLVERVEEGEDGAHRFHHIMIRDTAYEGILKRARADLHERFVIGPTASTATAGSSSRRSSATTSSRPGRISPSSARWTTAGARSARTARAGSPRQAGAPLHAGTSRPRRTSWDGLPLFSRPTTQTASVSCPSTVRRCS